MPIKPTDMTVAEYLTKAMELSGKTQREIGQEVGYLRPNVLSMMKMGQTKVPVDKIPSLARSCGVDPVVFLRIAMHEYYPELWEVLNAHFGETLSKNEQALIKTYREIAPHSEIEIDMTRAVFVKDALEKKITS